VLIPTRDLPALEKYRRVAAALGCTEVPPRARLGIGPSQRAWANLQLRGLPRPWLAIAPGAQWETKRWPPEHYAELARHAQRQFAASIVLVGSSSDQAASQHVATGLNGPVKNLAGQTDLLQLAAICEAADLFLSGDTGPMHLAAAVGTPVVSLFTCTSPLRAGPRGNESRIVSTTVPCASSYLKRCPAMICMQELTPERVWPTLARTFEALPAGSGISQKTG
jgi:lipopolysaccharide heptosyltransferase II